MERQPQFVVLEFECEEVMMTFEEMQKENSLLDWICSFVNDVTHISSWTEVVCSSASVIGSLEGEWLCRVEL